MMHKCHYLNKEKQDMKKAIYILLMLFVSVTVYADIVKDIAPYVYPNNVANNSAEMYYMPDGLTYLALTDDRKQVVQYSIKDGAQIEIVLDVNTNRGSKIDKISSITLSADGTKLLVYEERTPIYRHSFEATYYVYEIKRNNLKPLSDTFKKQQSPVFSPDGRMVAFVAENNIYIKKLDYGSEVAVTEDGKKDEIINGIPDWTYEEEFSTVTSMVWAPDNMTLCYLKYNEKNVPKFSFPLYKGTCEPNEEYAFYPGAFTYKYPVAGKKNSIVTLHSYDVDNRKTKDIALDANKIEYIPRISYSGVDRLMVATLNRNQNRFELYAVNPKSTVAKSIYVDESATWISPASYEEIVYNEDNFVIMSEKTGYNHLYQYSYNGTLLKPITYGEYDVTAYYGNDIQGNHYYQSTEKGALNRVVVKLDKKGKKSYITPEIGINSVNFSPDKSYYILNNSDVNTPPNYTLYNAQGKKMRVIAENAGMLSKYGGKVIKEFFEFSNGSIKLNGYMVKPIDFDASKKYPVIMTQYSGPGSQQVLNRWVVDWDMYAAQHGYIVVCVDGRGTGGRGKAFQDVVYKNLGYYETEDQIAAAEYVASLSFVDEKRIGICGWSYGGYETLMAISIENAPYKAAVAIAPVTDWRYYDTVYAERYMSTPQENEDGYNESAPINRVDKVKCNLLLMSGTADDNVHLSNTMEYVSALQNKGILCDMLLFPNMNHSIYGCNARALVYAKMIDYFNKNM